MKWKIEDMEQLLGMEEYVDTLLYPVSVSSMEWDINWISDQYWIEKVSSFVEEKLTGRVFLFQPLCVARNNEFLSTTIPFVRQNIMAMAKRFPHKVILTNSQELADAFQEEGTMVYLLSPTPEEKVNSKRFLEKSLIEANRVVQKVIGLWSQ
jgi:hypothetical protein